ncbi:MAG TPA: c-type cytochrome [Gemmatimonadales bacterium]|nr:c-type cytochrome [Gemmatimonadales bacterium]
MRPPVRLLFPTLVASMLLAGCSRAGNGVPADLGSPERGREALAGFGCGACHQIPGIRGARGSVGPPLTGFANRSYIAGQLVNSPDNLIRWIVNPQAVEPGTAMPNLGVVPATARDMAAYLYTLQ